MPEIKVYLDDELLVTKPIDIKQPFGENQSRPPLPRSTTHIVSNESPVRRISPRSTSLVRSSTSSAISRTSPVNRSIVNRSVERNSASPGKRTLIRSSTSAVTSQSRIRNDLHPVPHTNMEIDKQYYYITDGVIKRGIYYQYDNITGPEKPYVIKKEEKDISPTDKNGFEFVDKVYYIPQARGGKKRRTRRGKKSSRKSRKSRK